MSRKKPVKRSTQRSVASSISPALQKIEMDIVAAPAKFEDQLSKELAANKQREAKLVNALRKVAKQIQVAEARIKKSKATSAAKKTLKALSKSQADLSKQLQTISQTIATLTEKQNKAVALRKSIALFEKTWSKTAKAAKAKAKSKATTKVKAKKKRPTAGRTVLTVIETPLKEVVDTEILPINQSELEPSELAS